MLAPPSHRLKEPRPGFSFEVDKKKLAESASARSASDYEKARKRFSDELGASKKKLFHSLRVPLFALQIAKTGKIHSFGEANGHFAEIMAFESDDFADYEAKYGPLRARLCDELKRLSGRR